MGTEVDGPASASAPRPPPDKRSSRVTAGDVCYWAFSGTRMTTSEVCREAGPCAVQGAGSRLGRSCPDSATDRVCDLRRIPQIRVPFLRSQRAVTTAKPSRRTVRGV